MDDHALAVRQAELVNLQPNEKFDPELVAAALREARGIISYACQLLGCSRSTIYNYMERYPEVLAAKVEAKEELKDVAESQLIQAIENREGWAICFFLKTQAKDRGYNERREISGEAGGPIAIRLVRD